MELELTLGFDLVDEALFLFGTWDQDHERYFDILGTEFVAPIVGFLEEYVKRPTS